MKHKNIEFVAYESGYLVVTMSVKPKFRLNVEICHCIQETLTPWWR